MTPNDNEPQSELADLRDLLCISRPKEQPRSARNRAAALDAAARLFAEHGVEAVSMGQVAAAAGVGKATLYRRFGDKSGMAAALLDARVRVLQEAIVHGPPPLGPGAPHKERLTAFINAYFDYLLENLGLLRVSETAAVGARYRVGGYRFWHRHTTVLLGTTPDPEHTAHALLAALAAEHIAAILPTLGEQRVRAGLIRLALSAAHLSGP